MRNSHTHACLWGNSFLEQLITCMQCDFTPRTIIDSLIFIFYHKFLMILYSCMDTLLSSKFDSSALFSIFPIIHKRIVKLKILYYSIEHIEILLDSLHSFGLSGFPKIMLLVLLSKKQWVDQSNLLFKRSLDKTVNDKKNNNIIASKLILLLITQDTKLGYLKH